jgi:uncharacterized protein (TIGR01244 family)
MTAIRKINNELTIAGQLDPEQLKQIVLEGIKSVLNLRSPDEPGFLSAEQQIVEAQGLYYVNLSVDIETLDDAILALVLQKIRQLPKPILIHCDNAVRSVAFALIYIAIGQGATYQQALQQAEQLGLFATAKPMPIMQQEFST